MTSVPTDLRPLALLTTSYPMGEEDGAGTFVAGFCRALVERGQTVEVLCPERPKAQGDREGKGTLRSRAPWRSRIVISEEAPGIRVLRIPYAWPSSLHFLSAAPGAPEALERTPLLWGPALAFGARLAFTLALRARGQRYGGVVAHWLLPSALAGLLGAPSLPTLGIAHGSDVHLLGRLPGGSHLARLLLRRTAGLCFVSEDLRRRFGLLLPSSAKGELGAKSVVAPMGVDLPAGRGDGVGMDREVARETLGLQGAVILWMGRLVPLKAPGRALELVERLAESRHGVTLVIAGDGPLAKSLHARARSLGDRVRFTGFVSGARKQDLLAAADVLLITSTVLQDGRTDSLPVVALEAMASGVPVVATAVGGLPSLALPASVLRLVPDGQLPEVVASLATAVGQALDGGLISEPIRQRLCARFGWEGALPRILGPLMSSPPAEAGGFGSTL